MKKTIYYAVSEFGSKEFCRFKDLVNFLKVYYPKWIHKIKILKDDGKHAYEGRYLKLKNGGLKVKF